MQPSSLASLWIAVLLCAPSVVWAEAAPPEGSKPLTEILRPIEARSDFAYFEEIELEEGKYKIEYFTKDGSKQKIEVDPLTGAKPAPAAVR
jgi:peptidase YpeB-like protein